MKQIGDAGLALIKHFESCSLEAYRDGGGVPTIGWGHTGADVKIGETITQEQADALLIADLRIAVNCVNSYAPEDCPQAQFDAVVSLTFNAGCEAIRTSRLARKWKAGNILGAAAEFVRYDEDGTPHGWIHDNGKVVQGLINRRDAEKLLFLGG